MECLRCSAPVRKPGKYGAGDGPYCGPCFDVIFSRGAQLDAHHASLVAELRQLARSWTADAAEEWAALADFIDGQAGEDGYAPISQHCADDLTAILDAHEKE